MIGGLNSENLNYYKEHVMEEVPGTSVSVNIFCNYIQYNSNDNDDNDNVMMIKNIMFIIIW